MNTAALALFFALAVGALSEAGTDRSVRHAAVRTGSSTKLKSDPTNTYWWHAVWAGGCATDTQAYPPSIGLHGIADHFACAQECVNTMPDCSAFSYCDGSNCKGDCNLYALDPTKSNGYPSVTCFSILGSGLYDAFGYLKGGCTTQYSFLYPPKLYWKYVSGHMHCEVLCNADHNCGSYDFSATDNTCSLYKYDQKMIDPPWWSKMFMTATCSMKKITNARGKWLEAGSTANGEISQKIEVGSATTEGRDVTETLGVSISAEVKSSCEFLGLGVDATMSTTASVSTSVSISESLTKSITLATTAKCNERAGQRATLYQWWVQTDQSKSYTSSYRCHYTTGDKQAPQCPDGFCGDLGANPFCAFDKCLLWRGGAGVHVAHGRTEKLDATIIV